MESNAATSLFALAGLVVAHLLAGTLGPRLRGIPRHVWLSFASGVPVVFVFLEILPTLARDQVTVARTSGAILRRFDDHVYIAAFLGLMLFYGVESAVRRSQQERRFTSAAVFWLSIGSYATLNVLFGYLLVAIDRNRRELLLFVVAIGLKFLVDDVGLAEQHGERYDRRGRWLVLAALVLGWIAGNAGTIPPVAVAVVRSFLAGGIIMSVLKEELPAERQSRFWPFALSAALYGALLLAL
ncbi:MAG TPA: hypothetical protein VFK36_15145 [Gemmatimonadales bacterium]|nr:hypothetical protein [Gemmatimonadales bacterium]